MTRSQKIVARHIGTIALVSTRHRARPSGRMVRFVRPVDYEAGASRSTSAISSGVSVQPAVAALARTCSPEAAPAITEDRPGSRAAGRRRARGSCGRGSRRIGQGLDDLVVALGECARLALLRRVGEAAALRKRLAPPVPAGQEPVVEREEGKEREAGRSHSGSTSSSAPRFSRLYSFCTLTNRGFPAPTRGSASRSCSTEKFEQPISITLPASTSSASAPSVSAIGV